MPRWIPALIAALAVTLTSSACAGPTASPVAASSAPPALRLPAAPATPRPSGLGGSAGPGGPGTTVAVLGDSLSRGYNACDHFGDCPSVSWAGGTDPRVRSVASRLGRRAGGPVTVRSFARSGAKADELAAQVRAAVATRPDLATVLIGANDVCAATPAGMTSAADYAAAVGSALQQLVLLSPGTTVLVASVPDVTAILPAAAADPAARFLWSRGGCASVLADPRSTAPAAVDRRAEVAARIRDYDTALAGACTALPRCVYDGGALHRYTPSLQQLSALDRFHPSIRGLRELADLEWQALTASDRAAPLLSRAD